jgi:hypothetical protein
VLYLIEWLCQSLFNFFWFTKLNQKLASNLELLPTEKTIFLSLALKFIYLFVEEV